MRASVLDLRRRMKDILKALDRNETVTLLYRGREKARIVPSGSPDNRASAREHPAFYEQGVPVKPVFASRPSFPACCPVGVPRRLRFILLLRVEARCSRPGPIMVWEAWRRVLRV